MLESLQLLTYSAFRGMTPATGSEEMALATVRSPVGLVAAALCEVEAA
jgi:hypothetical protein